MELAEFFAVLRGQDDHATAVFRTLDEATVYANIRNTLAGLPPGGGRNWQVVRWMMPPEYMTCDGVRNT